MSEPFSVTGTSVSSAIDVALHFALWQNITFLDIKFENIYFFL